MEGKNIMKALIIYDDFAKTVKANTALQLSARYSDVSVQWNITRSREPHVWMAVWMAENCARLKKQFSGTGNVQTKKLKSRTCVRLLGLVKRFKRIHQCAQKVGATVEIAVRVAPQAKPLCQL